MNDYQILLDMIENAKSGDSIHTDEIDARFNCLFRQWTFLQIKQTRKDVVMFECIDHTGQTIRFGGRFSQSRTDLKDIRPEGWYHGSIYEGTAIGQYMHGYSFVMRKGLEDRIECRHQKSFGIISEGLAEMHAIVQIWAYERGIA